MHLYCTLFDRNYATRGLALHGSLLKHCGQFRLMVLCLDESTYEILTTLSLQNVELVSLSSLEKSDPELKRVRAQRTPVEYYFTCKPALMKFLAEKYATAQRITYLDSDLFYFSDPGPLELEYADSAVALTPHRFPPRLAELDNRGRFNAGWISVSCGEEGRRFIDWWRARCIEWCRWEVLEDRYGDQKYLDRVPMLFSRVTILDHAGANLAPWNLEGLDIRRTEDGVAVEGKPLVFFHFHGLRRVLYRIYDSGLAFYDMNLSPQVRRNIYRPYFSDLALAERRWSRFSADVRGSLAADRGTPGLRQWLRRVRQALHSVASGNALVGP
jgi:hypothetical protein